MEIPLHRPQGHLRAVHSLSAYRTGGTGRSGRLFRAAAPHSNIRIIRPIFDQGTKVTPLVVLQL